MSMDLSKPPEICDAESSGYRCDREKGHGALHHHPEPGPCGHDDWWLSWPHSEAERLDMSGAPWTGYLLIADLALPLSKDISVTADGDIRYLELMVEQATRQLAERGHVRVPGGLTVEQANRQHEDYDSDDGSGYT